MNTTQNKLLSWSMLSLLTAVSTTAALASPDYSTPAHTPFVTVLQRDFDSWDTNHDGVLSPQEIDGAVTDPAVKGDDAAAAASIKLLLRSKRSSCRRSPKLILKSMTARP